MTCIVGIGHEGRVYIGGDSMATDGTCRMILAFRKVFRVGDFLIGGAGNVRMMQVIKYHLEVRAQQDDETDERYLVVAFAEAVCKCLKDKDFTTLKNAHNHEEDGAYIVGYRGRVYRFEGDFQIVSIERNVATCGAGEQYALGALVALKDLEPEDRIRRALEISSELTALSAPPFYVEAL